MPTPVERRRIGEDEYAIRVGGRLVAIVSRARPGTPWRWVLVAGVEATGPTSGEGGSREDCVHQIIETITED